MLYFLKTMYIHCLINDTWSRLEPGWYLHAYAVAARIKTKNLLCVSALSMDTKMYDGSKPMMVIFWLEHVMLEHKNSYERESKQCTWNTVFITIIFRHQWNIDFTLMVMFISLLFFSLKGLTSTDALGSKENDGSKTRFSSFTCSAMN